MAERLSDLLSSGGGVDDAAKDSSPREATPPEPTPTNAKQPSKRELYALPIPIRTFPLPNFYPNNPLSLLHIAYVWLRQTLLTPREPAVIHVGVWSPDTRSVHVQDEESMEALWRQGFFGKGHLSRSEPHWKRAQEVKRGLKKAYVSELNTLQRRNERRQIKWERARLEQETIKQTRLKEEYERALVAWQSLPPPVGPLELLALPNSYPTAPNFLNPGHDGSGNGKLNGHAADPSHSDEDGALASASTHAPALNGSHKGVERLGDSSSGLLNGIAVENGHGPSGIAINGLEASPVDDEPACNSSEEFKPKPIRRRKSVRFSPKVESTTFQHSDPPSPSAAMLNGKDSNGTNPASLRLNDSPESETPPKEDSLEEAGEDRPETEPVANREHLQLTREEAFFLVFGLGVLTVLDPETKQPIPTGELFSLFRQYSVIPPPAGLADLRPDDKFLVHYAVYHHFRSLGWVPRAGLKFAVDWLLYHKGPVFDHAEFGILVIPSYPDPWWKEQGQESPKMPWATFSSRMRGLSQVFKTIVAVYVDIPPPPVFDEALEKGITDAMRLYKIREVIVRRFKFSRLRSAPPNPATREAQPQGKGKGKGKGKEKEKEKKKGGKKPEVSSESAAASGANA